MKILFSTVRGASNGTYNDRGKTWGAEIGSREKDRFGCIERRQHRWER